MAVGTPKTTINAELTQTRSMNDKATQTMTTAWLMADDGFNLALFALPASRTKPRSNRHAIVRNHQPSVYYSWNKRETLGGR